MNLDAKLSRRRFIKMAGLIGGASLIGTMPALKAAGGIFSSSGKVPTRPLGKTGVKIPVVALGTGSEMSGGTLLLKKAIELGVTYWDLAPDYNNGQSEKAVGDYFSRFPDDRSKVFLVTKCRARKPEQLTASLNQSLAIMKTSYVDMFMLHECDDIREMFDEIGVWARQMKAAGKIRFFGGSSHKNMHQSLRAMADKKFFDAAMIAYNYKMSDDPQLQEQIARCSAAGMGLIAMKIRGSGHAAQESPAEAKLAKSFAERGYTENQVKLKAVLEDSRFSSACVSIGTLATLSEYAAAAMDKKSLAYEDFRMLRHAAADSKNCFCCGCGELCESALGGTIPVPDILRFMMYDRGYGETDRARREFAALPHLVRQAILTTDYSAAEAVCPNGIPIARRMREAVLRLA